MNDLAKIIESFPRQRIVVIGDLIADQFLYGEISRVSREAPVFILRHEHTETTPGGAGNCAANLASLGGQVKLLSAAGDDEAGKCVLNKLRGAGVNCDSVLLANQIRTPTKVRVLAGQTHSTRQQVIRIDYDNNWQMNEGHLASLRAALADAVNQADAMIISDYNYGSADPAIANCIRELSVARKIPILVDSRFRLSQFAGFTSATPNEDEVEQLLAHEIVDEVALERAAEELRQRLGYEALLITRGGKGMLLVEKDSRAQQIEAVGSAQPVDVTGAGDTVMATYALAIASGASFSDAARLANFAGGVVVMKRGTACVTPEELHASLS